MTDNTGWQPEQDQDAAEAPPPPVSEEDISTIQIVRLLIAEGSSYATNEVERQKLRATILGRAARDAAILGIVALFLLMGTLIAGLIGLIMALAPLVGGAFPATGIVIGGTLIVIILLLLIARARVKKAVAQTFESNGDPS